VAEEVKKNEGGAVERISLLNVPLDIVKDEELDSAVYRVLDGEGGGKNIVLLSLMDLLRARRKRGGYRAFVQNARLVIPISRALTRGGRFLTGKTPVRYMPFEFIVHLLTTMEAREETLLLLGGSPHVLRVCEKKIRSTFPRLRIVGRFPAGFRHNEEPVLLEAIRKASPSLLLAGSGLRDGEGWLVRNDAKLSGGLRLWCSDVFDVFAQKRRRPSKAFFDRGLEWIGFCLRNPLRLFRLFPYIYYNFLLLVYKLRKKKTQE